MTATSNPGDVFTGFSGGLTGTTDPQTITMNAPYTVSASFETVLQAVEATVTRLIENSSLPPAIKQLDPEHPGAASHGTGYAHGGAKERGNHQS